MNKDDTVVKEQDINTQGQNFMLDFIFSVMVPRDEIQIRLLYFIPKLQLNNTFILAFYYTQWVRKT